ncbi:hypothetical protein [Sphaerospermopsis sp. LEGE 00249]|uniref:hypothetical protein n=1 Tax=Sphaerospermopsis sp. LEGE 00249 TaxID=1380707 RepID=UPI00210383C3|nr:hypothetical protein [Sphaerospermopsis sp. LEGE 00249]
MIDEFIVIVESGADARTATKLAERVLKEKVSWLDDDILQHCFQWSGLIEGTKYSCWKNIKEDIPEQLKSLGYKIPRYRGHPGHKDGANAIKTLTIVSVLQKKRNIRAVIFIRDTDTKKTK